MICLILTVNHIYIRIRYVLNCRQINFDQKDNNLSANYSTLLVIRCGPWYTYMIYVSKRSTSFLNYSLVIRTINCNQT